MRLTQPAKFTATDGNPADIARFLAALNAGSVFLEPFSHLQIDQPLSEDLLTTLLTDYPTPSSMKRVADRVPGRAYSRERFSLSLPQHHDPALAELPASYRRLSGLLRAPATVNHMTRVFPNRVGAALERFKRYLNRDGFNLRVSIELIYDRSGFKLRPHTDGRLKLVTGLIYLAEPGDPVELGTRLYRPKDPNFKDSGISSFPLDYVEDVKLIPYIRNTMVLFARTDQSFHGVTPDDSGIARRLIQFSVTLDLDNDAAAEVARRFEAAFNT